MGAPEHQDGSQDPPLGGIAGLPVYPGSIRMVVEREEVATAPVLSRRRFLRRAFYGIAAAPVVAGAGYLGYTGFFGEDPEERARWYRSPRMGEPVILGTHERYPYSRSALRIHAEEEVRLTPQRFDHVAELCTIADNIADQVSVQMKEVHGGDSMTDALRCVGENPESLLQYANAIAAELRQSGCFYQSEGSLANAVDPAHPRPLGAAYHLDCDLLCLIALHAASRHDVPLHAVSAPSHMYLGSPPFPELAIEMTAFRGEITGQRLGRGLRMVPQWDTRPTFSSSHGAQRARWRFAREDVPQEFRFFQSMSEEELQEAAIGSVLFEMADRGGQNVEKLRDTLEQAERESGRGLRGRMIPCALYSTACALRNGAWETWRGMREGEGERQRALVWAQYVEEFHETPLARFIGHNWYAYDTAVAENIRRGVRDAPSYDLWLRGVRWWPAH